MNVLYISYDGALDPLGRSQVVPYLERLSGLGHRFDLLTFEKPLLATPDAREAMRRRLAAASIRWHPMRYHKRFSVGATAFDLAAAGIVATRLVKRRRIDLIHARSYPPALVARQVARRTGAPYVFDMRGLYPEERVDGGIWPPDGSLFRLAKRLETTLLRDAGAVVTLTEASVPLVRSMIDEAGGRGPLAVIPTCVDLARFRPATPAQAPCLAYLGSLGTWYMLPEMLSFGRAAAEHAGARLRLIVNQSDVRLDPMLAAAGFAPGEVEVRSVPYDKVPDALADASATFAFIRSAPSKVASAATKLSESLALGLPVAVNEGVGDAADIVRQEGVGVVVDPSAPASFPEQARALLALGGDESVRRRCRAVAERVFSLDEATRRYDQLYAQAVGRPSATPGR